MQIRIQLAAQKSGRLTEGSLSILKECGIRIGNGKEQLKASARSFPMDVLYLRNSDIPQYVHDGVADIAILGEDTVIEKPKPLEMIQAPGFSKFRLSIALPKGTP